MSNKGHTQLVRGGQTTQHWTRMATQVVKYTITVAAAVFVAVYAYFIATNYTIDGVRLTGTYWMAKYNVLTKGMNERAMSYLGPDGVRVTRTAEEIFIDPYLRDLALTYRANARYFIWVSLMPALAGGIVTFGIFYLVGRNLKAEEYIRGARLVNAAELKAWSRRKWRDYERQFGKGVKSGPRYTLAGIPFPPNAVEAQTGLTGTVGVGKTNAMHELLNTVRAQNGRAIIYDRMGALLRDHYDPERDIILNAFDRRSMAWSPFNEMGSDESIAQIAEVMIPDHPGSNDPFWTQAARLVFTYAARQLRRTGQTSNEALRRAIMTIPADELAELVQSTPGAHFFGENIAKTSGSIRANLITELRFLEYLRDTGDPFSVRDWIMNDQKPGFVFLTGDAEKAAATRNVISTVLEVAANALMTTEESRDPKVWFFLDEVPTLNRLPFLPRSLAEIRQFGGAFVVGYQVYSQLEDIYGEKAAETISGVLNNRVVFNTPDFKTAERSSRSLGEEDVIEQQENLTLGAHDTRDGVGIVGRRTQRPIVTPAEIQSLPQFAAYFRPAYDAPAAKVLFEPVKPRSDTKHPKFIPYGGGDFDEGGMALQAAMTAQAEGHALTHLSEFAAQNPDDQLKEFRHWAGRVHPQGLDGIDGPENRQTRLSYWERFATDRVRGLDPDDITPPTDYDFNVGGDPKRRILVDLPFPGEDAKPLATSQTLAQRAAATTPPARTANGQEQMNGSGRERSNGEGTPSDLEANGSRAKSRSKGQTNGTTNDHTNGAAKGVVRPPAPRTVNNGAPPRSNGAPPPIRVNGRGQPSRFVSAFDALEKLL